MATLASLWLCAAVILPADAAIFGLQGRIALLYTSDARVVGALTSGAVSIVVIFIFLSSMDGFSWALQGSLRGADQGSFFPSRRV